MKTNLEYYLTTFPHYRGPLEVLQSILDFQANLAPKIETGRPKLSQAQAITRWEAQHPLFSGEAGFNVDPVLFQAALAALRPLLLADDATLAALDRLLAAEIPPHTTLKAVLLAFGCGDNAQFQQLAHSLLIAPEPLAFLLQTVLPPFVKKAAQPYQPWLEAAHWRGGHCPVCGCEPLMARLSGNTGQRVLTCLLCHTQWAFDRLRCPFCEDEAEPPKLNYFTVDNDEAHRVECCNQCHRYLKTVDDRRVNYLVNLLAEDVITAHLDTLANEQGYR